MIRNGTVAEFLHSRETLAAIGHGVAGHARAMPGNPPLVRMSNTFIENGDATFDELIAECRNGILLKGSRGGQVDPGRGVFQFNAEFGYFSSVAGSGGWCATSRSPARSERHSIQ